MRPLVQVILASTRPGRFGSCCADWVVAHLRRRDELRVELVDLLDHPLPFYAQATPPAASHRSYATPEVARWGRSLDDADGYVVVTPEYNHGYPAELKNAIDHTFVEWNRKPIAFVGYGNVGGARAIEQLRQVAVELEMVPLRHAVHVLPEVMSAAKAAPDAGLTVFAPLEARLQRLADDLLWWTSALRRARAANHPPVPL